MSVIKIHNRAIVIGRRADNLLLSGNFEGAKVLYQKAAFLEMHAGLRASVLPQNEPTRSILYLSSASFAFCAKNYIFAEKRIIDALSGEPPQYIRNHIEKLNFEIWFFSKMEKI